MTQAPLAERMRPHSLEEYVGQEHLVGEGGVLRKTIESGMLPSMILWGPPGVGKTTLAFLLATVTDRPFISLSAINSGVKDIRDAINTAQSRHLFSRPNPLLFIDEIHRFSKSQQDALLGAVEKGIVTLIGATTENPSFEVISALLSRCQVYVLKQLEKKHLLTMIERAVKTDDFLKKYTINIHSSEALLALSGGDGRKLYNCLELVVSQFHSSQKVEIDDKMVTEIIQKNLPVYDKNGEQHYDVVSAFIKSVRSSDPNAAVYYLAKMIYGGEDPMFICRRLIILASEDIGLANPNALLMANNCMQAVHQIGMPEGRIIMSQTAVYLALSPKSNSTYRAIDDALAFVEMNPHTPVPLHLRNAPTSLMKELNYGKDYLYAHDFDKGITQMECMPEHISGKVFYHPGNNPHEDKYKDLIQKLWSGKYSKGN